MENDEFRRLGHDVTELLAEYLDEVESRPVFPDVEPAVVNALFHEPLPREPCSSANVLRVLQERLLPYCTSVNHPGYFGLITPTPTPVGAIGDFIASVLNQNIGAFSIGPSATAMERQTVRWLTDLAGYGEGAGGNLTSGGTMANFLGFKLARDFASGDAAQHEGMRGEWAAYVSEERHVSVDKAADCVGLGRRNLRIIPTDEGFRVRLDALEEAIADDRRRGVRPMCIIGLAGTTNTGSIDDLRALRSIADRAGAWLHVDAAYGGGMLLSQRSPDLLDGLGLADSITIDPHKWFFAPVDVGALLVRDSERLTKSFGLKPAYLTDEFDPAGERYQYYVHGLEQSRRFRGLKVWMTFKRYGANQIGRWIDANVEQAQHLCDLCHHREPWRVAMKPAMSAICIRYEQPGLDEAALGRLHQSVVEEVERGGRFWLSTTVLKGKWWFRINPVNFRTRLEHMDQLLETLETIIAQRTRQAPIERRSAGAGLPGTA